MGCSYAGSSSTTTPSELTPRTDPKKESGKHKNLTALGTDQRNQRKNKLLMELLLRQMQLSFFALGNHFRATSTSIVTCMHICLTYLRNTPNRLSIHLYVQSLLNDEKGHCKTASRNYWIIHCYLSPVSVYSKSIVCSQAQLYCETYVAMS